MMLCLWLGERPGEGRSWVDSALPAGGNGGGFSADRQKNPVETAVPPASPPARLEGRKPVRPVLGVISAAGP